MSEPYSDLRFLFFSQYNMLNKKKFYLTNLISNPEFTDQIKSYLLFTIFILNFEKKCPILLWSFSFTFKIILAAELCKLVYRTTQKSIAIYHFNHASMFMESLLHIKKISLS